MPTLHIVFSPSGAGCLRKALHDLGRQDRVACLFDDLSLGPVDTRDQDARLMWLEQELRCTGYDYVFAREGDFWRKALNKQVRKVAWLSRRSASEYAGFLEWLWRLDQAHCEIVDLTDATIPGQSRPVRAICLALIPPDQIIENGFIDRAEPLAPALRDEYRGIWQRLRAENAPLRVLSSDGLVSAPITFFDSLLLSCTSTMWKKDARVVGEALMRQADEKLFQTGELLLISRLYALIELGLLEGRGDLSRFRQGEVRLPNQT